MVVFRLTKRFIYEYAANVAPIYFGVSLPTYQVKRFVEVAPREVSSLVDLHTSLENFVDSLIEESKKGN